MSRRFLGGEEEERQKGWSMQRLSSTEETITLSSNDHLCGLEAGSWSDLKGLKRERCKEDVGHAREVGLHSVGKAKSRKDSWEKQSQSY